MATLFLWAWQLSAQVNSGELRLRVIDPIGAGASATVRLVSDANDFRQSFATNEDGALEVKRLSFGKYELNVTHPGFEPLTRAIEIRSAVPLELMVQLRLEQVKESVDVNGQYPLIDPYRAGSVSHISSATIANRATSLPGRSLQDLVNSQPGWLYEGNAVLHPRGSEYQTQFVIDGIPLTENRSPGFGPELEADNVQSMSIYTAGIPAEYGRKMGGVIEVNTAPNAVQGLHGQLTLFGGSFGTAAAYGSLQYQFGKNTFGFTADGSMTSHYLNPPVPQNYTNMGTAGDFAASYERDLTPRDRLGFSVRHELAHYEIPNEQVQQAAGQRQNADDFDNMGTVSYQHIFSSNVLGDFRGMVRSEAHNLWSNDVSTPIIAFQHNSFIEGYFKGTVSIHHGNQEWKTGLESDCIFLNEQFSNAITDPSQFDPGTPTTFSFTGSRPDLEQSAFVQDLIRLHDWTISAGLRWDHYQLLANQNAVSPRLAISRYFAKYNLLVHAAYDRVFQTPSFENILLSSSPTVVVLNPDVLRLPVEPSHGNYYELGLTKSFLSQFTLDLNSFLRNVNNFADDDQLLNTAVSFPIAFKKGYVYGAEAKLNVPHWGKFAGYVSYSYMVGSVYFPVTGGLFLGQDATDALTRLGGRFWDSQDQRNTVRARFRYQIATRLWAAFGGAYGSGLPIDFTGTYEEALAQYGRAVLDRVNLKRGRVKPSFSLDLSVGVDLWSKDKISTRLQFDATNINNRLNLINFAGLFSGNAIDPPRSFAARLQATF